MDIHCILLSTSLNVCNTSFIIKHVEKKEKIDHQKNKSRTCIIS